jgi:hypothetical protein
MQGSIKWLISVVAGTMSLCACSVLENASNHDFGSGYYSLSTDTLKNRPVYVDVTDEMLTCYHTDKKKPCVIPYFELSLSDTSRNPVHSLSLKKTSIDIDITTILFKYRFSPYQFPKQFLSDLNLALYSGWRTDYYLVRSTKDPLGRYHTKVLNRGYDFGLFAGVGTTLVSPFSTDNNIATEYNAMIIQYGVAGFLESKVASFGIAVGMDNLMSPDRTFWIYEMKPWIGLIIGIALN